MIQQLPQTKGLTRGQMAFLLGVYLLLFHSLSVVWAGDYSEGFEGESKSWQFVRGASRAKSLRHERTTEILRSGKQSEAFQLDTFANDGYVSAKVQVLNSQPDALPQAHAGAIQKPDEQADMLSRRANSRPPRRWSTQTKYDVFGSVGECHSTKPG